ncbi:MAG: hypothetical protein HQL97_05735 [Magnetococcales bacterium]|nr:hypothetical protein [Magnetococcales bacterium]MBF0261327.1 hypothetical protein [Magnetococcales bacterium]
MHGSYEAIYEQGRLTWIGAAPEVARARVVVTVVEEGEGEPTWGDSGSRVGERLVEETRGAWGRMTLAECEAWMQRRRQEDWGGDELAS